MTNAVPTRQHLRSNRAPLRLRAAAIETLGTVREAEMGTPYPSPITGSRLVHVGPPPEGPRHAGRPAIVLRGVASSALASDVARVTHTAARPATVGAAPWCLLAGVVRSEPQI